MTVQLSSLRITADFDASAYTRAMAEKTAADREAAASSVAVGQAIRQTDTALGASGGAIGRLARTYIDGAGSAAKLAQGVRLLGRAIDTGNATAAQAATVYSAMANRFGLVASATELAAKGQADLANVVAQVNTKFAAQNEVAARAAEATQRAATAAQSQAAINQRFGIGQASPGDRGADIAAYGAGLDQLRAKYNPLFAAGQQYRQTLADISQAYRVGAISQAEYAAAIARSKAAFAERVRDLGNLSNAERMAAAAAQEAAAQTEAADARRRKLYAQVSVNRQTVTPDRGGDIAAYGKALDDTRAKFNPYFAAAQRNKQALAEISDAYKTGAINEREYAAATDHAKAAFGAEIKALGESATAHRTHGAAAYGNQLQMMELAHVGRSLVDSMAAGQNPLRTLTMEMGRLQIAMQAGEGGFAGLAGRASAFFGSILTPSKIAVGGVLALGGAALLAASQYEAAQNKIYAALQGKGRGSGLTVSGFDATAQAAAATANISLSQARSTMAGLIGTGMIPGDIAGQITGATRQFSRASGLGLDDAGKELAKAFGSEDLGKGMDMIAEKIGGVDDRTRHYVETLAAQGDRVGALQAMFASFNSNVSDASTRMQAFTESFTEFKNNLGQGFNTIGGNIAAMLGDESLQHRKDYLEKVIAGGFAFDPLAGSRGIYGMDDAKGQLAEVNRKIAEADKAAADKAADFRAQRESLEAAATIRSTLPSFNQREMVENQAAKLRTQLADPKVLDHLGLSASQAQDALDRLDLRLGYFATDLQKTIEASNFQTAATSAQNATQRAAIEYMRTFTETLRSTSDAAQASAAAIARWNDAVAQSNKSAEDAKRQSLNAAALIGKTPLEQQLIQADQKAAEALRNSPSGTPPQAFVSPAQIASPLPTWQQAWQGSSLPMPVPGSASATFTSRGASSDAVTPQMLDAYNRLTALGVAPAAAAGFVGGLTGESGRSLNPSALNGIGAYGMAQWTDVGGRKSNLLASPSSNTFSGQFDFLWKELETTEAAAKAKLNAATTVQGGLAANLAFERPSQKEIADSYSGRLANGQALYDYVTKNGMALINGTPSRVTTLAATSQTGLAPLAATAPGNIEATRQSDRNNALAAAATEITQRATEATKAQADATRLSADTFGKSAQEIAETTARQKQLNEASAQHLDILLKGTPAWDSFNQKVEENARLAGLAAKSQQDLAAKQQQVTDAYGTIKDASHDALSSIVTDLRNGASASTIFDDALTKIEDKMFDYVTNQSINSLFGTGTNGNYGAIGGGLMGGLQSLFGTASVHHAGGIVGEEGWAPQRMVPLAAYRGAPRFHSGFGFGPGELPAILKQGESVNTVADTEALRQEVAARRAAGARMNNAATAVVGGAPVVHIHESSTARVGDVQTSRGPDGRHVVKVMMVDHFANDIANNGPMAQTLQRRYGLGRSSGSPGGRR